ncbi:hypothetical protein [Mucilaginibacter sp. UYCu711]|uniref:hypothetical protein n=1 Tax=Mucilaginibacter sp. UYCu711 TaxID=3156339 RepID=UPI003D2082E1
MKLITLCALLLLIGCANKKNLNCDAAVNFIFINKSATQSNLTVSNGTDSVVISADCNASQTKPLCFKKNPKIDGHYILHVKNTKKDTVIYRGYFTNGYPMESNIRVLFEKDTLAFETISHSY